MKITKKLNSATLAFLALGFLAQVDAVEPQSVQTQQQPQKNPKKLFSTMLKEHVIRIAEKELDKGGYKGFLNSAVVYNTEKKLHQFKKNPDVKLADINTKIIALKQQVAIIEKLEEGMSDAIYVNEIVPNKPQNRTYKIHDMLLHKDGYIDVQVKEYVGKPYSTIVPQDDAKEIFKAFTITKEIKSKSIDDLPEFLERIKSDSDTKKIIEKYLPNKTLDTILNDCREQFNQESRDFIKKHTNKPGKSAPNDGYEPLTPAPGTGLDLLDSPQKSFNSTFQNG
jgi:hypothetical protein